MNQTTWLRAGIDPTTPQGTPEEALLGGEPEPEPVPARSSAPTTASRSRDLVNPISFPLLPRAAANQTIAIPEARTNDEASRGSSRDGVSGPRRSVSLQERANDGS